jgi:hypothetical protein
MRVRLHISVRSFPQRLTSSDREFFRRVRRYFFPVGKKYDMDR